MTVNHLWLPDRELEVTGTGFAPEGEDFGSEIKEITAEYKRSVKIDCNRCESL